MYRAGFVQSDRLFQDPFILVQKDTITLDSLLLSKQNHTKAILKNLPIVSPPYFGASEEKLNGGVKGGVSDD